METERAVLRSWEEKDANDFFNMPVIHRLLRLQVSQLHTNVENSKEIVKSVLSTSETYSVVLKEAMQPAGSIGLKISPAICIRDS